MMLSKEEKKEAIRKFREKKSAVGIFAVRCTASGGVWVGSSRDLRAAENGTWFSLRIGGHRDATLQEEWNAQCESSFTYEVLETLKEDESPLLVPDLLKEKKQHWSVQLGARSLL